MREDFRDPHKKLRELTSNMKMLAVNGVFLALLVIDCSSNIYSLTISTQCDINKDSFINLCGICVGESTGLKDSEGQDKCGVCFGSDDCMNCNSSTEGCNFNGLHQKIDLASNGPILKLYLKNLDRNSPANSCIVKPSEELDTTSTNEGDHISPSKDEGIPFLAIEKSHLKIGSFHTVCFINTSNEVIFKSTFQVVDSRMLEITSLSPRSVTSNVYFKVLMNVTMTSSSLKSLLCFTKVNSMVESIVRAANVASGMIECDPMIVQKTSEVFIGAAETMEAILDSLADLKIRQIVVHPSVPMIKRSTFSSDLRLIFIEFDQNINSANCSNAFSLETVSLFGKGWQCWIQANQLIVQLGSDPDIHPGSRLSLLPSNDIQHTDSIENNVGFPQGSTTVVDDVTYQVVEPIYNVMAPHVGCHGMHHNNDLQSVIYHRKFRKDDTNDMKTEKNGVTILEVQHLGGQSLLYNWSVSFNSSNNKRAMSQRDMLMTWLSVRLLDKSVRSVTSNRVSLNNSLMLSGVEYTVTVKGTNALGMSGEEKRIPLRLQDASPLAEHRIQSSETMMSACTSGTPLDVIISSPPAIFSDTEFRVEVSTTCCDGTLMSEILGQIGYKWIVKSTNGSDLKVGQFQGKYLLIPPGTLPGGNRYEISCELYHKAQNKRIGLASTFVKTLERGIQINLNVSGVGISTNQPLILDASASKDFDKLGILEFEWSCRIISNEVGSSGYGDNKCYMPNKEKTLLQDHYRTALRKSILHLPAGSLPIGRYHFSLKVSRSPQKYGPGNSVMTAEVSVLGGSPPLVFIPSRNSASNDGSQVHVINPDDGATLTGVVQGIKSGCRISWGSVDLPGYMTLNHSMMHQETYTAVIEDSKPREFTVELSSGLIGDAKYRFRLSAICPSYTGIEMSYADTDILTDAPPVVEPLTVEPLEGEALITEFKFSTQPAYDDLLDYPLKYYFGFRIPEDGNNVNTITKYFHSSSQKLSATTYLPTLSLTTTKIQSVIKVCDVRHICRTIDGPLVLSHAPKELTTEHVVLLSEEFSSYLMAEEYDDAIMLVESSMVTLEVLEDKSLYQLASKNVEKAVNSQLDSFDKRLESNPEEVDAALRFLKAANTALKHGAFSQETLQRLVAFKDKILSMLSEKTETLSEYQRDLRLKRQAGRIETEQSRNILQPEMVRTLLSVSEVAIFNLSDISKALSEKRKLLQNVSFFMDSLCKGLRNSAPIFIGSRVVSFSVQRLNLQVKYRDDLAIPDWRSAKSGGAPVNATALIRLGENVQHLLDGNMVCMGAAFYPMDFLSEVSGVTTKGLNRHSSVYQVKIIQNTSQKVTVLNNYDGLDIKKQTVRVKIPVWPEHISSGLDIECRVWSHENWDAHSCKLIKLATIFNKPAAECLCSVVGYYAVFVVESPKTTHQTSQASETSTLPTEIFSTQILEASTVKTTQQTTSTTKEVQEEMTTTTLAATGIEMLTSLPPGTPIPNTSQNFTFKIQEDFSAIVGSNHDAFISRLKQDILKQVEMPSSMIASIDVSPGSILVTLHLVDTDIRTVDDVLPSLAAALQDGHLSINGVDGRHLSVPRQSLMLLQRRTEHNFVPWIVTGCTGFGLFSIGSLVIAAIFVKRQLQGRDFMNSSGSQEMKTKTPSYGRFHLEQTLDGSEATLSRYRGSVNNPLVISTIGALASVMGTNALFSVDAITTSAHFKLQSPQSESRINSTSPNMRSLPNPHTINNGSGNTSESSGTSSITSIQKRIRNGSIPKPITLTEDKEPIMCLQIGDNSEHDPGEEDSGIVITNGKIVSCHSNNSRSQTPDITGQPPPDVIILPGTPTARSNDELPPSDKQTTSS